MFLNISDVGKNKVFGLDCEMCYTTNGFEAIKISVVDYAGNLVYDSHIKPSAPITDMNTEFHGIQSKDLENKDLPNLAKVQQKLQSLIGCDTILCGHSLDSDLKVLKIIHEKIVDTSAIYPHPGPS